NGNLVVDGAGSTATATGAISNFGLSHSTGTVTFSNGGSGSFPNGLQLAARFFADTAAAVVGDAGGHLNTGLLGCARTQAGGESPTATLTVTDANSSVSVSADNTLQLSGPAAPGNATLNVQDNGSLTVGVGGNTAIYPGAVLNINGGYADLKTLNYNGGT